MVKRLPSMVDMSLDAPEKAEMENPTPPKYPYGLCICFCNNEIDKLKLGDVNVGDVLHLFALGKVTSKSDNDTMGKRIEVQLTAIASEDEDDENEEVESAGDKYEKVTKKLYTKGS